jgi:hypothetical protein
MDELIKKAVEVLEKNSWLNEVELSSASGKVRLVRKAPVIWYYQAPQTTCGGPTYYYQYPPTYIPPTSQSPTVVPTN